MMDYRETLHSIAEREVETGQKPSSDELQGIVDNFDLGCIEEVNSDYADILFDVAWDHLD